MGEEQVHPTETAGGTLKKSKVPNADRPDTRVRCKYCGFVCHLDRDTACPLCGFERYA